MHMLFVAKILVIFKEALVIDAIELLWWVLINLGLNVILCVVVEILWRDRFVRSSCTLVTLSQMIFRCLAWNILFVYAPPSLGV